MLHTHIHTYQFVSVLHCSHVPRVCSRVVVRDERIDLGETQWTLTALSANLQTLSNRCFPLLGFLHIVNQGGNVDRPLDHGEQSV